MNSFSLGKTEVTCSQDNASDHTSSAKAPAAIQNAGFEHTPSPTVFAIRVRTARKMAGWKTRNNNSSTTVSELWRNAGPSAFQLQVSMLKSDKICYAYLVVNCVGLRTF